MLVSSTTRLFIYSYIGEIIGYFGLTEYEWIYFAAVQYECISVRFVSVDVQLVQ